MNLSACLIVKNEEKHIKDCLDNLKWCDEVILVDTGSTDNTVKIAKTYPNVKLFRRKFNIWYFKNWKLNKLFHFSNARNYSLAQATKDWIFIIDADERLYQPEHLEKLMSYGDVDAWYLLQNSQVEKGSSPCKTTRLFRNHKGIHYSKITHETADEYIDAHHLPRGDSDLMIEHIGFLDEKYNVVKSKRVIQAIEYEGHPYKNYYLGVAYVQLKDWNMAMEYLQRATNDAMPFNIMAHAHSILGDIYRQHGEFFINLAEQRLNASIKLAPEQNLSYLVFNSIYRFKNLKDESKRVMKIVMNRDTLKTTMHQDILLTKQKIKEEELALTNGHIR